MEDSARQISGSPGAIRERKNHSQSERRADSTRAGVVKVYSSPSKSSPADVRLLNASASSSPNASRYKQIIESPSWRRGENFVRQSQDLSEDPFVTSADAGQNSTQGKQLLIATRNETHADHASVGCDIPPSRRPGWSSTISRHSAGYSAS